MAHIAGQTNAVLRGVAYPGLLATCAQASFLQPL